MPDVTNMIRNALNNKIEVEVHCYEFLVEAELSIASLDTLLNCDLSQMDLAPPDSD